ncbi:MAG: RtcB family protein [Acidobacteria bacterium]|nr:RtcB family protein [Acidobacteriota bacterium]MCL5289016.1 RtcB family protein [Acidobacteriota bacterium]
MAIEKSQLKKLDAYRWLVPRSTRAGMLTDALIYADDALLTQIVKDLSIEQAMNVAFLPGIVGRSLAMPDIHQGYGFPIGGVAATDWHKGVISPGGVGFDINCGVRLLATTLTKEDVTPKMKELVNQLFRDVPSGTGSQGSVPCSFAELNEVLERGAAWVVERGYGEPADVEFCEESGCMAGADARQVSDRAKQRGRTQIGTLGSGNHFLEVQYVQKIFEPEIAETFGLREDQVVVLIHCGSRGLGHQVCTDYLKLMNDAMRRYSIELPDRQLACVPIHKPEGEQYLAAMAAAANFAWANRQAITHFTRKAFERIFGGDTAVRVVYDVAHNIAKRERHKTNGGEHDVLVHRKGATRSFPAGSAFIPAAYKDAGQPVLIPGSMGTASYVLVGNEQAMQETFGTVCHGAGRAMSRTAAKKGRDARVETQKLADQGIILRAETRDGILEEVPEAYKDIDAVVDVVHNAGLARKVARLRPMGVIKG